MHFVKWFMVCGSQWLGCEPKEADVRRCHKTSIRIAMKETDQATYQAMEAFIHNLNTMHSRAGAQVPFSSINYGTDTTPEGRCIIRELLFPY